jgi:hypothetical protein
MLVLAMKLRLALVTLFSVAALRAADVLPVFNATLTMGKEHRFVLVDAEGKSSSFLSLGESFAGYKLKAYDPKEAALDLERDGQISRVKLVGDVAIQNAPATAMRATMADAESVLNKMHFEEMMDRALAGQKKVISAQFQRVGAQIAGQGGDPADAAAFQKKILDEVATMLDAKQLKSDIAKIYSEVFSKQELEQLSAFYSTPIGEMLSTKQQDVQEKFGAVMQTRMMEFMPKVQKMGQEFALQQKAKREAAAGATPIAPK